MTEALPQPPLSPAPLPENEVERLAALRRYRVLDTPPEIAFDRITTLAARLFEVPIALVSLVDESRAWFKSCYGFELQEVQRDATICSFALLYNDVLVVPDARQDDRFVCNPFVTREPGLRFYAGAPLLTHDGFNLGTLCLLDMKPHAGLTDQQIATLTDLAAMVVDELELRLAAHKMAETDTALLEVTRGVAATTGEAFAPALVQHLNKVLGVDYTYIGLVAGDTAEAIETIAVCAHGEISSNFSYRLSDTPCEAVLQTRQLCCYPSGVQSQFPRAPLLEPLNIDSYAAVPFYDSTGAPIGLLGVMHSQPLANVQLAETLLPIFALRIATELERQRAQQALERLVQHRTAELMQANHLLQLQIAERQQAEIALQKEQEMLRVLLDNVQAGIVACDADGILTLFNQAAREFHGLPEQPLPPQQWAEHYDLYLPDGKTPMPTHEIPLFRALQGETIDNVEMVIAPRAGKLRTLLASGQAIVDRQGQQQGAAVVMHDITERKQAEAERAQLIREQAARLEAEAANRMKDEFLAILSHELRTPLNPILGWSKLLQTQKHDPDVVLRGLQTIERNAKLQTQLIEDLLDVSRILRGKLSLDVAPVELQATIEAAMETVCLAAEAREIQLHTQFEPDVGRVSGDAGRLQQVVWNLLSNAVKFTPPGGRVTVKLERVMPIAGGATAFADRPYAQITITDTGEGIKPEFLPHIFERFRQADSKTTRKFGGLGLGLAIVRHLTEMHGGTVQAESLGAGLGATFTVRLPLLPAPVSPDRPAASPPPADLVGTRILAVDDDDDIRDLIEFILRQAGAEVQVTASATELLHHLEAFAPEVLICDIGMPEIDGYALMRQIRARPPQQGSTVPAIALTAYAAASDQQQAIAAGFQMHLAKPVEPDQLIQAIVSLLRPAQRPTENSVVP